MGSHEFFLWLGAPAVSALGSTLSNAEVFGFVTGVLCVWLVVKKNIWNFPLGILSCLLLFFLFWESRLFADSILQIVFILLGIHGWYQWARGRVDHQLVIFRMSKVDLKWISAAGVAIFIALFLLLRAMKGSVPLFDALITSLSIIAQYLLNKRKLESWYVWITVDLISVPVYVHKELYLIAILYAIFLILCVFGLNEWRRRMLFREHAGM